MSRAKKLVVAVAAVLVGLPLVGAGALALATQRRNAGVNGASVDIARPPAEVFAHVAELQRCASGSASPSSPTSAWRRRPRRA